MLCKGLCRNLRRNELVSFHNWTKYSTYVGSNSYVLMIPKTYTPCCVWDCVETYVGMNWYPFTFGFVVEQLRKYATR